MLYTQLVVILCEAPSTEHLTPTHPHYLTGIIESVVVVGFEPLLLLDFH
jgi:hypothetical protein